MDEQIKDSETESHTGCRETVPDHFGVKEPNIATLKVGEKPFFREFDISRVSNGP